MKTSILVVVLLMTLLVACTHESKQEALIFGFKSHSTFSQVKNDLNARGLKWEVLEDSKLESDGNKSKFHILEIRVEGLVNTEDGVFLSFFNDDLMKVWFSVESLDEVKEAMKESKIEDLKSHLGQKIAMSNNVSLLIEKGFDGRVHITCEEVKLSESKWNWIKS